MLRLLAGIVAGVLVISLASAIPVTALNVGTFILFILALLLGAGRTAIRIIDRWRAGARLPRLLPRDLLVIGGLALSFLALGGASALNALGWIDGPALGREWWWVLIRNGCAVTGACVYVYFEFLVIGNEEQ